MYNKNRLTCTRHHRRSIKEIKINNMYQNANNQYYTIMYTVMQFHFSRYFNNA
jgi:hypothetical protein